MSLIKASAGLFENYTFVARPSRTFSSSSSGITGSVKVFPQASTAEKITEYSDAFNDENLGTTLLAASSGTNVTNAITKYLNLVSSSSFSPRNAKEVEVIRFEPSFSYTGDSVRKDVIRNVVFPYYNTAYPSCYWGYTNYHSLNFVSGAQFTTSSCVIYANPTVNNQAFITPSGSFTFEFYVKPTMRVSGSYRAGTILHTSSSFALSIVSGSQVDDLGNPESFRIMLQLSHSANVLPSQVDLSIANNSRTFPNDLIFLSDDLITHNGWHHFAVRWGGSTIDFGSGSFFIDGAEAGDFYIPSESVTRTTYAPSSSDALFIGNFYDGPNTGNNLVKGFFHEDTQLIEGFTNPFGGFPQTIPNHTMSHPLAAELHEIRIWQEHRDYDKILTGSREGFASDSTGSLKFHLGPHFIHDSPTREVLYTPFQSVLTSTNTPYAKEMSFGVGGHLINVENHTRELTRGYYPRMLHLTASAITQQNLSNLEANGYLYATASIARQNIFIIPCDNGKFVPNFSLLLTSSATPFFKRDPSRIELTEVLGVPKDIGFDNDSLADQIAGGTPDNLGGEITDSLAIYQRTKDQSSNLVTFFDASNLFYGGKIHPGTYELTDSNVTGSQGLLSVTLKDNGMGGLYRADATTPHAKWNSVGSLLYEEGIAVITSPYLGEMFGKDSFEVTFKGEHRVPLLTTNVTIPAFGINSSSMPSYQPLTASDYANEVGDPITYITRINFHDENLNIIAKAELAQPIAKRLADKFIIRTKFDF